MVNAKARRRSAKTVEKWQFNTVKTIGISTSGSVRCQFQQHENITKCCEKSVLPSKLRITKNSFGLTQNRTRWPFWTFWHKIYTYLKHRLCYFLFYDFFAIPHRFCDIFKQEVAAILDYLYIFCHISSHLFISLGYKSIQMWIYTAALRHHTEEWHRPNRNITML
jgi:hypothetical protein